jgi:hypothetical protein
MRKYKGPTGSPGGKLGEEGEESFIFLYLPLHLRVKKR